MTLLKEFNPRLSYDELDYLVGHIGWQEKKIENTPTHNLVKKLADLAYPSRQDKFDKVWSYFYLPLKRRGHFISLPFWITEYQKKFFVGFHQLGNLQITKGRKKVEEEYQFIFKETLRFVSLIKKTKNKILEKTVPYDIRTGKILGKYVLEELMSKEKKKKILRDYGKHQEKKLEIPKISLNEYLGVAAFCYRAVYKEKTKNFSPKEMYDKWADGRHGGMLDIKDWNSKKEFMNWEKGGVWAGSHPFEIVFSWHEHGIHLYPPDDYRSYYVLRVTNYGYARDFVEMVKVLIKKEIPFKARDLEDVVNYLAGETYFTVNDYDKHFFHYFPSREHKKLFFYHIKWDEIKVPKWKGYN